jgi:pyridoxine 5-phosphate synthase
MARLSVNINKIATLRNARGGNNPNLLQVALDCERFGAQGITVHPRPDERHIRYADVLALKPLLKTEFNIEGYPEKKFLDLVAQASPAQVTLVPDAPDQITSFTGWDCIKHKDLLTDVVGELHGLGIRVAIFINAEPRQAEAAAMVNADRVELYTGPYAHDYFKNREDAIKPYIQTAEMVNAVGLGLNAGHDLDLDNLKFLKANLIHLDEVSIGHALVCDALYSGLENVIPMYLRCLV